jgi:hypothetical protein
MGGSFVIAHSIDSLTLWEYHRNRKREIWLSTLTQESEQEVKIWSEKEVRNIYTQEAFICSSTSKYGSFEIREIYSWGYTSKSEDKSIPAEVANRLLENSWELKLGAWAKVGDSAAFVSKIDANADSQSLYDALKITLTTADEMEHELTGREDVF